MIRGWAMRAPVPSGGVYKLCEHMFPAVIEQRSSSVADERGAAGSLRRRWAARAWDVLDVAVAALTLEDDYDVDWGLPAEFDRSRPSVRREPEPEPRRGARACEARPPRPLPGSCRDARRPSAHSGAR